MMMVQLLFKNPSISEMKMDRTKHDPVMLYEVLEYLKPRKGGTYIDGTLGMGGHAKAILEKIGPEGHLIGIDQDANSLREAKKKLSKYARQCTFVQDNHKNIEKVVKQCRIKKVDGIVLDLGISSFQLDDPERGFSLKAEGPLDMRMDKENQISAYDLINSLSEKEISKILRDFGEERWHQRIARSIVEARAKEPISTTQAFTQVVMRAMPKNRQWQKIHPATRTFQAFRIAVNRELESLDLVLDQCADILKVRGRLAVIAFHSLEDRIVKQKFRTFEYAERLNRINKKPLRPTDDEVELNPRARSARLRVAERI